MRVLWRILTPGGYLRGRIEGTQQEAEEWCRNHYLVWKLEPEPGFCWPDGTPYEITQ